VKTDKKDAQALSEVSCRINLPSVHVPSKQSREWKALCSARDCLVTTRTKLINHVRGLLRTQVKQVRSGSVGTFPQRVREKLLSSAEGLPMAVERELSLIEQLNQQIAAADQELAAITAQEPRCRRLITVPGVGPVTALRFVAAVDGVSRFHSAHALQSYLGLTPGEDSSSTRERRTSITKAGSPVVRWLLVQAAWCALRTRRNDPMVQWALEVARRRGPQVAAVALSRKLAGILYAILRDGTSYQSSRGAQAA
jgi:transposase